MKAPAIPKKRDGALPAGGEYSENIAGGLHVAGIFSSIFFFFTKFQHRISFEPQCSLTLAPASVYNQVQAHYQYIQNRVSVHLRGRNEQDLA